MVSTGIYRMALGQAAQVAANGANCPVVDAVGSLAPSPAMRCLIVDQEHLEPALAALPAFPRSRVVALCSEMDTSTLAAALREPRVAALLSDGYDGPRSWEVAYAVRRCLSPGPPVSLVSLFHWAHTKVSFTARSTPERDRTVDAVGTVARRFGLPKPMARQAMQATAHLLDGALRRALGADGRSLYTGPDVVLAPEQGARVEVVIDAENFGIEVADPHGSLPRADVFGALLRGQHDTRKDAEAWSLTKLHDHATLLRFFVEPGVSTRAAYVVGRTTNRTDVASIHWEERDPTHVRGNTPSAMPRLKGQER